MIAVDANDPVSAQDAPDAFDAMRAERARQVFVEGYECQHDDAHKHGELAIAAAALALYHTDASVELSMPPFRETWMHELEHKHARTNAIRRLEIAGALIGAEIERLKRKAPPSNESANSISAIEKMIAHAVEVALAKQHAEIWAGVELHWSRKEDFEDYDEYKKWKRDQGGSQ